MWPNCMSQRLIFFIKEYFCEKKRENKTEENGILVLKNGRGRATITEIFYTVYISDEIVCKGLLNLNK